VLDGDGRVFFLLLLIIKITSGIAGKLDKSHKYTERLVSLGTGYDLEPSELIHIVVIFQSKLSMVPFSHDNAHAQWLSHDNTHAHCTSTHMAEARSNGKIYILIINL